MYFQKQFQNQATTFEISNFRKYNLESLDTSADKKECSRASEIVSALRSDAVIVTLTGGTAVALRVQDGQPLWTVSTRFDI